MLALNQSYRRYFPLSLIGQFQCRAIFAAQYCHSYQMETALTQGGMYPLQDQEKGQWQVASIPLAWYILELG